MMTHSHFSYDGLISFHVIHSWNLTNVSFSIEQEISFLTFLSLFVSNFFSLFALKNHFPTSWFSLFLVRSFLLSFPNVGDLDTVA